MAKSRRKDDGGGRRGTVDAVEEIRGPLAVINNAVFLLEQRIGEIDDDACRFCAMIKAEIERANALINGIVTNILPRHSDAMPE